MAAKKLKAAEALITLKYWYEETKLKKKTAINFKKADINIK